MLWELRLTISGWRFTNENRGAAAGSPSLLAATIDHCRIAFNCYNPIASLSLLSGESEAIIELLLICCDFDCFTSFEITSPLGPASRLLPQIAQVTQIIFGLKKGYSELKRHFSICVTCVICGKQGACATTKVQASAPKEFLVPGQQWIKLRYFVNDL